MPGTKVLVSDGMLTRLYEAQKLHTIEVLQTNANGDDGGDYITSALDCLCALQEMSCDQSDLASLDAWLNTTSQGPGDDSVTERKYIRLEFCAGDGICDALYELDCPALPKEG
jgi:hypothetical protein